MKAKQGSFCPVCGGFFHAPGCYQHIPKCVEKHNFETEYKHNSEVDLLISHSKEISMVDMMKALIRRNNYNIEKKIEKMKKYVKNMLGEYYDCEEKLRISKIIINNNIPEKGIYFIRCNDFVKIGYTTRMCDRLKGLQTANPYPLDFLLGIKGSVRLESFLHNKFQKYRIQGEWFELSYEIESFIKGLKKNKGKLLSKDSGL